MPPPPPPNNKAELQLLRDIRRNTAPRIGSWFVRIDSPDDGARVSVASKWSKEAGGDDKVVVYTNRQLGGVANVDIVRDIVALRNDKPNVFSALITGGDLYVLIEGYNAGGPSSLDFEVLQDGGVVMRDKKTGPATDNNFWVAAELVILRGGALGARVADVMDGGGPR